MGRSGEHGGRILPLCRLPHVVVGAVLPQVVEEVGCAWVPEVSAPCMADRELVEPEHVCHRHLQQAPMRSHLLAILLLAAAVTQLLPDPVLYSGRLRLDFTFSVVKGCQIAVSPRSKYAAACWS